MAIPRSNRSSWLLIAAICVAMGATVGFVVSSVTAPSYVARVSLIVGPILTDEELTMNDIQVGQALAVTYADLATTRPVLERAIASAKVIVTPEKLAQRVTPRVPVVSNLLEIEVADPDPNIAAALANAIAAELIDYPLPGTNVGLAVVDPAVPPVNRQGPGMLVSTAVGAGIGLILALSVAFLVENLRQQDN